MKHLILFIFTLVLACPAASAAPKAKTKKAENATTTPLFQHPWQGKRVAYFGDSITDPEAVTGKDNLHFWSYLQQWLNIEPYVYAIIGRQWNDIPEQTERLKADHGRDFDAILIFMGTNDYMGATPLGEWYNYTDKSFTMRDEPHATYSRRHRTLSVDGTTLRGRINIALEKLKREFPDKQIVLLTPIRRGYAFFGGANEQPTEQYANQLGLYINDYIDVVKEAGQVWAVPVVDLGQVSGLQPQFAEYAPYFVDKDTDMLHPNELGHKRIAQTLLYQLLAFPCTLD